MSKLVRLSADLALPLDVLTQTVAVVAKRRVGKSYLARRFAEQAYRCGQQIVIVDPKGDWHGIRSSRDGKGPGLSIVIVGGARGDVPLEASGGELVAKLVVEERVSALLDLSDLRKHEVATFMSAFLETLYRLKNRDEYRTAVMLIIDEADAIAPQNPSKFNGNESRMLGAAEDIVRRGGQRGIGCMLITQRTAVLSKNVLTQAQILIALRTIAPQDLKAMQAWIDVHGEPEQRETLMHSLPALPVGDAWVWSPGWPTTDGIFQRIHTAPIETFDSGATPKPGEKRQEPKKVADVDLDTFRTRMAETIERAKAEDPKALRAEIATARKRIAELERELQRAKEVAPVGKTKTIEVRVFADKDHQAIERAIDKAEKLAQATVSALDKLNDGYLAVQKSVGDLKEAARLARQPTPTPSNVPARAATGVQRQPAQRPAPAARPTNGHAASGDGALPKGERIILIAIAQHGEDGVTREQLTVLSGYKRSTRDAYLQRLGEKNLIESSGYAGGIRASNAGIAALGSDYEPLPTGDALRAYWLEPGRLPDGERRILELVCEHPSGVDRDAISVATGFKRSTRDAYLQRLGARKLVSAERGSAVPSESLFG